MKKLSGWLLILMLLCGLFLPAHAQENPEAVAVKAASLSAPVLKKAVSTEKGVRLTWKKVRGATGYVVYRRKDGASSYKKTKTLGAMTSWTDESAAEGQAYQYRLTAIRREDGATLRSKKSKPLTGARFAPVTITEITGKSADSVRLRWTASKGCRYDVKFSPAGKNKYTLLKKNTTKTAYTAKELKNKLFDWIVVPKLKLSDGSWLEGPPSAVFTARPVAPPALTDIKQTAGGVRLSWQNVTAGGYTLYRAEDGGGYTEIAKPAKDASSYTDSAAQPGHDYSYRIEAWRKTGGVRSVSALSGALRLYVLGTPAAPSLTLTDRQQLLIQWDAVPGADHYEVNVRFPDAEEELTFQASENLLYHDDIVSGIPYRYRVRAVRSESGETHCGPWSPESSYTLQRLYRALLIGNTYADSAVITLPGPDSDVQGMRSMLGRMDGTDYAVTVKQELTASQIVRAITDTFADAQACDVSLVYYSGHGHDGSQDATPALNGALVGTDGATVTPQRLRNTLDQIPGIKIVLLDSCYSGAHIGDYVGGGTAAMAAANRAVVRAFRGECQPRSYPKGGHVRCHPDRERMDAGNLAAEGYLVITACSLSEESFSVSLPDPIHYVGLMTSRMLYGSGWDEQTQAALPALYADSSGDGALTFSEVAAYTELAVQQWSFQMGYTQHVMRYPTQSDEVLWQAE